MTEASGHDSGLLLTNNISFRTFGSQPLGKINSLNRVDGPNCVYTSHMATEPGLIKFIWHWFIYQLNTRNKFTTRQSTYIDNNLAELSKVSFDSLK